MRTNQKNVRRTQTLGHDRLIIFLEKQGREIYDQYEIIERIEEFYIELYDTKQSTDPKEY